MHDSEMCVNSVRSAKIINISGNVSEVNTMNCTEAQNKKCRNKKTITKKGK